MRVVVNLQKVMHVDQEMQVMPMSVPILLEHCGRQLQLLQEYHLQRQAPLQHVHFLLIPVVEVAEILLVNAFKSVLNLYPVCKIFNTVKDLMHCSHLHSCFAVLIVKFSKY